jgi:hypothetical protein
MSSKITASPDPVAAGKSLRVCYEFSPGQDVANLTIHYSTPDGDVNAGITLTPADPCYDRDVPSNCTGVLVTDDSGAAEDVAVTVTP